MFFTRRKKTPEGPLVDPSVADMAKRLGAPTLMAIEALEALPGQQACRVVSSALRDKIDVSSADMRRLATELDRDADRRERLERDR